MPEITRDGMFEAELLGKIMARYQNQDPRSGKWHVSDILYPRYALFSRLTKRKPTREDIGYFLTGEAYHQFIQGILGETNAEVRKELHDVIGTADYFDGDVLLEIKTSRKWTVPELPQDTYIEQARYYCVLFGKKTCKIVVIFPVAGRKWDGSASSTVEVVAWDISFSEQELSGAEIRMQNLVVALDRAWKSRKAEDVRALPPCPSWKYGSLEKTGTKRAGNQTITLKVKCDFANMCPADCAADLERELASKTSNSTLADRYAK